MFNLERSNSKDAELEAVIGLAIRSLASDIHISAEAGHVILSGRVADFAAKRQIDSLVQSVAGVNNLTNGMQIVSGAD
jgi:hypothetical protein